MNVPHGMLTPQTPPPEDYYQNNCRLLFKHVLTRFPHLLDTAHKRALLAFLHADDDAQRLFARLLTRKGPWLRCDSLDYREVGDTQGAIDDLQARNLVQRQSPGPADALLNLLRKPELVDLAAHLGLRGPVKNLRKSALIQVLLHARTDARLHRILDTHLRWLAIAEPRVWEDVKLLYFGGRAQDWSTFVMQDLGMVRYEAVSQAGDRYDTANQFVADKRLRYLADLSYRVSEHPALGPALVERLGACEVDRWQRRRRNKSLLRVAQVQEKAGELNAALHTYAAAEIHPARERQVRILTRINRDSEAQQLLDKIRAEPLNEEEALFAARFGRRLGGYQPPVLEEPIARIDPECSIEEQALQVLQERHGVQWGVHSENALIRSLTGLRYWNTLFAPAPGAFTNPFQVAPHDLTYEDFALERAAQIAATEAATADAENLHRHLVACAADKWGIANALVSWRFLAGVDLEALLQAMPAADVAALTAYQIRNLYHRRTGFPDLFVAYGDGSYELVEVKGPNDQLQPGQRLWFARLDQLGIPARVLKLRLDQTGAGEA